MDVQTPHPTPPAKRGMSTAAKVTIGVCVALLVLCGGGTMLVVGGLAGTAKVIETEAENRKADVAVTECTTGDFGTWEATVQITNSGKTARTYWVQVNLMQGETRLGEAHAIVNDLGPGQKATEKATGALGNANAKGVTCVVGDVN